MQAGNRNEAVDRDAAGSQPALEPGLRLRPADRWPALPDPGGGRRLHPRVPGVDLGTSLSGQRVVRELDEIIRRRGRCLDTVVSDNGTELASNAIELDEQGRCRVALHRAALSR